MLTNETPNDHGVLQLANGKAQTGSSSTDDGKVFLFGRASNRPTIWPLYRENQLDADTHVSRASATCSISPPADAGCPGSTMVPLRAHRQRPKPATCGPPTGWIGIRLGRPGTGPRPGAPRGDPRGPPHPGPATRTSRAATASSTSPTRFLTSARRRSWPTAAVRRPSPLPPAHDRALNYTMATTPPRSPTRQEGPGRALPRAGGSCPAGSTPSTWSTSSSRPRASCSAPRSCQPDDFHDRLGQLGEAIEHPRTRSRRPPIRTPA